MNKSLYRFLLSLMLLLSLPASASVLSDADKAYQQKDYVKAITLYTSLRDSAGASSELYYNLGNAYTNLENYGPAVVCYRRALKLDPGNSQASNNLTFVKEKVALSNEAMMADKNLDPTPESTSFFGSIRVWLESPGSNFWAVVAAVLFVLLIAGVGCYIFMSDVRIKKIAFFSGIVLLLLSGISLLLAFSARRAALAADRCVLITPSANLYGKPADEASRLAAPLTGGTEFHVIQQFSDSVKGNWVKVRLNNDFNGWLPASDVEVI